MKFTALLSLVVIVFASAAEDGSYSDEDSSYSDSSYSEREAPTKPPTAKATDAPKTEAPTKPPTESACDKARKPWKGLCLTNMTSNGFTCQSTCGTMLRAAKTGCASDEEETAALTEGSAAGGVAYCGAPVKPTFNKAAYDKKKLNFQVVAFTPAAAEPREKKADPVAPEDTADFKYEVVEVQKPAVDFGLKFPITKAEAEDPKMQDALTIGMANSLGLSADAVSITHIGGEAVSAARRLADLEITFQIIVDEADTMALEANIKAAAEEGSIIAAIQEEANSNGVLTQKLFDMPIILTAPTVTTKTVTVKVVQAVDKNAVVVATPTKAPTKAKTNVEFSAASSVCPAFVSMVAVLVVSLACTF